MKSWLERLLGALLLALTLAHAVPAGAQATPSLQSAVSRKVHAAAGTFDLALGNLASNPATEPRFGPAHTIVFTFDGVVTAGTASATEGAATVGTPTFIGNELIVPLTAVSNVQFVTVAVSSVSTAGGGTGGSGSVRIGFLAGDVNQSRVVSLADLGLVNAQLSQVVTASNYLKDVNASGTLTLADKGLTNARLTQALPAPGAGGLPPDPTTIAPPVDPTVATDLFDATAFLYTGANPIQTGVVPGTILAQRAAVLRGTVHTRVGAVLSGVTITILAHPEFGQTLSRANGAFDLVVNGGGPLTVNYQKTGFLPVQRQVNVPWRDYAWLPDVVMIPFDTAVTTINLAAPGVQVARGSPESDADGARRATILFPSATTATMVMPNGTTQPLTLLNVRATEYTVGASGPRAMPAALPPSSGYTYAAELSVDEAVAAGAIEVRFNQALPVYVENFLGFPVGGAVPTGYYDRQKGQWIASANGRVIKVLSITNNMADLDIDGTGIAANVAALTALGVNDEERTRVAQLYAAGQTLWRAPITHFTPWDTNWPYGPPPDAAPPPPPEPKPSLDKPDEECGSIIGCESQTLGESVPVTGTPWRLHYQSERTPGSRVANTLQIPLSGPAPLPASLRAIRVEVNIAGRLYQQAFAPAPNLKYTVYWDGQDGYGRRLMGAQPAVVQVIYDYVPQFYAVRTDQVNSFGRAEAAGLAVGVTRGSSAISLSKTWTESVGVTDARGWGLGGWSLSIHHAYDPVSRTLLLGDGRARRAEAANLVITTVAGTGAFGFSGDGGPATAATLSYGTGGVAVGPDGSMYIADYGNHRIRRVGPDGIISTVVGNGVQGFNGDGGLATAAQISSPIGVAVGPDGSLYIADYGNNRIRRVKTDGIITTVVGNGVLGFSGDGGPATAAQISSPIDVAVGSDGSVYTADNGNSRIRRVGPDGLITTVAGNGVPGFSGDGGPATAAQIYSPAGVAVGPDGSLFFADQGSHRIRRVGLDGIIATVAGNNIIGFSGDGGPATAAQLKEPYRVAVGRDGSLYISDSANFRVRHVRPDGIINSVAGNGVQGFSGDGGPGPAAQIYYPVGVVAGPDGTLIFAGQQAGRIRRVGTALPGTSVLDFLISSEDGSELYLFSSNGRHMKTLDALTGALRHQFGYSIDGYLITVTDGFGNVMNYERTGAVPTAIVAPFGQRTTLAVQGDGYLSRVTNPAGEAVQLTYNSGNATGLMATLTDASGNLHSYMYDALGRLIRDENPAGGVKTLARTDITDGHYTVTVTTALGLVTTYEVEALSTGGTRRVRIDPSGARIESLIRTDGSRRVTYPDGTVANLVEGPDPRFGMQAPILKSQTLTTPGGRNQINTRTQSVTLANPSDLLSLSTLSRTLAIDGRTTATNYDATTRTLTFHSPASRTGTAMLDAHGFMTRAQVTGLDPVAFGYTANGRVGTVTEGTGGTARTTTLTYGSLGPNTGYLTRIDDALGQQTSFDYNAAGRATQQTLPGARTIGFGYNATGNLASLTPPGRAAHTFAYTADQQLASYTPPTIAGGGGAITYSYDTAGRLSQVNQADGQTVNVAYDASGRPSRLTQPGRIIDVTYQGTTANIQRITGPAGQQLDYGADGPMLVSQIWSGPIVGTVSRTLDNGLRTATRSVNAVPISLNYDQDSLLTGAGALTLARHADHGLVSGTTLGSVTDARTYNGFGGLDHYTARFSGTIFLDVQYTRDALGRITARSETIAGITDSYIYGYDAAGRLAEVRKNGAVTHTYTYDTNGNRVTVNAVTATHDGQDRLTVAGTTIFAYTQKGEVQTKTAAGGTTIYTYDAIGNLLNVSLPGGTQVEYLLDGLSRRIGKKVGGALMQGWLYDERSRIVAELDGTGALVSRFVYASRANVPDYMVRSGAEYRLVSDHLGTVRLVVKAGDGSVAQRLDYDPFGSVTNDTAPGFQPFGFAGGLFDRDTKLVRYGARDYDPETARWTTKDPILFAGGDTNLYAYASNDPVNRHDSNGLDGPSDGGVCLGPPPDLNLGKPLYLDPKPRPPPPPLCPTCAVPAAPAGGSSGGGGGGASLGPFKFSGKLNWPSVSDLGDWNPTSLFDKFDLKLDAPLNPDFTLPDKPKESGGPDPNGPNPKPQGPQCKREPEHDPGFTSCE